VYLNIGKKELLNFIVLCAEQGIITTGKKFLKIRIFCIFPEEESAYYKGTISFNLRVCNEV